MTMAETISPVGSITYAAESEVADFSAGDHEFSRPTEKGIRVVAGSGGGTLRCRMRLDDADVSLAFGEGVEHAPYQIVAIRRTGTSGITGVTGFIR